MIRLGVTVPEELLNEFDEVLKANGYNSRSKGLIMAIKEYIGRHE